MSDDIVTRLRDYLAIVDHAFVWNELSEAADEIERLRATLENIASIMREPDWSPTTLDAIAEVFRAAGIDITTPEEGN